MTQLTPLLGINLTTENGYSNKYMYQCSQQHYSQPKGVIIPNVHQKTNEKTKCNV